MGTAQLTEWDLDNDQAASGGVDLVVDFDPKSLALTYSPTGPTQGSSATASGTYNESPAQQTSQSTSLSLELLFDTSTDGTTVQAKTDPIVSLTQPAPLGDQAPARKVVRLSWGTFLFYGTITSLSQTIDFFSEDGVPLRAELHVSLTEVKKSDPDAGSGGSAGAGAGAGIGASVGASASFGASAGISAGVSAGVSVGASAGISAGASAGISAGVSIGATAGVGTTPLTLTQSGDTVQSLAARTSGSWKTVAAANGIDNPRLLPPGTVIDARAQIDVR
ncbi:hypothetical protein GCM10028801_38060 [Nocardioides maradonensis]